MGTVIFIHFVHFFLPPLIFPPFLPPPFLSSSQVAEWIEGKEHNIRALINSLPTILWEEEKQWKQVGMHKLMETDQVNTINHNYIIVSTINE